ncbi:MULTISPECIES: MoaD/ThiS family protein [Rothia]|uniref:Molybdopterin synthase sulfur carrier subunit n=1 Tax=Rothia nasimurium TaxID=85336 RepID=A0A1Y1RRL3_9MICC|nr:MULTISPECIES: MoaD/ThiS family protein [Rothia]ORC24140.1 hypothetical protein A7979_10425 [Rothia nasimurium]
MQINFFAAARAAAGVPSIEVDLEQLGGQSLAAVQAYLVGQVSGVTASGQSLADILPRCSFLVDGVAARGQALTDPHLLAGVARLDVLPPFAGG